MVAPQNARSRSQAVPLSAASLGLALLLPLSVEAEEKRWKLIVDAPAREGCAPVDELSENVRDHAGVDLGQAGQGEPARIAVKIERAADGVGWIARMSIEDPGGQSLGRREHSSAGPSCAELTPALTLMISAAVGIEHVRGRADRKPVPKTPLRPQVDESPIAFSEDREVDSGPSEPWQLQIAAGPRFVSGIAPDVAPALYAELGASVGALALAASAVWLLPTEEPLGSGGQSRYSSAIGQLDACWLVSRSTSHTLGLCASAQAGLLWANASGLWRHHDDRQIIVQLGPSVRGHVPLWRWLALAGAIGAAFPTIVPHYAYTDADGVAHTQHSVGPGLWAQFGVMLRFGS